MEREESRVTALMQFSMEEKRRISLSGIVWSDQLRLSDLAGRINRRFKHSREGRRKVLPTFGLFSVFSSRVRSRAGHLKVLGKSQIPKNNNLYRCPSHSPFHPASIIEDSNSAPWYVVKLWLERKIDHKRVGGRII